MFLRNKERGGRLIDEKDSDNEAGSKEMTPRFLESTNLVTVTYFVDEWIYLRSDS